MILRWLGATPRGGRRHTGRAQVGQSSRKQEAGVSSVSSQGTRGLGRVGRSGLARPLNDGSTWSGNHAGPHGPGRQEHPRGGASRRGAGLGRAKKGAVSGNLGVGTSGEPPGCLGQRGSKQLYALLYLSAREKSSPWLQHPRAATLAQHRLPVPALG